MKDKDHSCCKEHQFDEHNLEGSGCCGEASSQGFSHADNSHKHKDGGCCRDHSKHHHNHMDHHGHSHDHNGHNHHGHEGHEGHSHHHHHHMSGPQAARDFLRRFWIATFLLIPLFVFTEKGLRFLGLPDFAFRKYVQFFFATWIFYYALVFFEHAKHEIKARSYGMMTLVSLAVGAGYLFSAASTFLPALQGVEFYIEISTLIWVLLFGHYLEAKSSSAAGDALQEVAKLLPKKAHLLGFSEKDIKEEDLNNLDYKDVSVDQLKAGDLVFVKAGEKIPADGRIILGSAFVDESLITGESKPVERRQGEDVVAGSICIDGQLVVKLSRVGESSTVGQIKSLVAQAAQTKPKAQRIADKASSILTFIALGTALATVVVWSFIIGQPFVFGLTLAITVLVIACPHALGLAIPTVSTIATSLAVKNGFFIKDMSKIEVVKDIDWVIFDKTGTLTEGRFEVTKIREFGKSSEKNIDKLLAIAASLEKGSTHPIAFAIVDKAKQKKLSLLSVGRFKSIAGKGVSGVISGKKYFLGSVGFVKSALKLNKRVVSELERYVQEGKSTVVLFDETGLLAVFLLGDKIKKDSYKAIDGLHKLGVKVAMLTGDNKAVAQDVASKLGIDIFFAEVSPEDKYKAVKSLQEGKDYFGEGLNISKGKKSKVMMVGDGINDAPALTQADVGVAIGAGTDVAVEAGDIVLTRNNPKDIVALIKLSQAVYRKMVENLFWALGYNIVAIPAAAGLFMPWGIRLKPEWAAVLMSLSSVIVVVNALRLRFFKA